MYIHTYIHEMRGGVAQITCRLCRYNRLLCIAGVGRSLHDETRPPYVLCTFLAQCIPNTYLCICCIPTFLWTLLYLNLSPSFRRRRHAGMHACRTPPDYQRQSKITCMPADNAEIKRISDTCIHAQIAHVYRHHPVGPYRHTHTIANHSGSASRQTLA